MKTLTTLPPITEKAFMQQVIQLARLRGWRCFHVFDSRRSAAGFPDLTLVRGKRLVFLELKRDGKKPTEAQADWLGSLGAAGAEAYWFTPSEWEQIEEVLA